MKLGYLKIFEHIVVLRKTMVVKKQAVPKQKHVHGNVDSRNFSNQCFIDEVCSLIKSNDPKIIFLISGLIHVSNQFSTN